MFSPKKPDPRVWLLYTSSSSMLAFMLSKRNLLPVYVLGFALLITLFCLGGQKTALKAAMPYIAIIVWEQLSEHIKYPITGPTFSAIKMIVLMYEPPLICGFILGKSIKLSELLTALANMKLSRKLILPLAVAFRYFPTLKNEISNIRESLLLREMKPSILHPISAMEYYLVPLLMRSLRVSDELTRSALCRAYSVESSRSTLVPVKLNILDYSLLVLILFWNALLWLWAGGYFA